MIRTAYRSDNNYSMSEEEQRQKEKEALTAIVMSLFVSLCSIYGSGCARELRKMRPKADRKLLRMIRKKEISLAEY